MGKSMNLGGVTACKCRLAIQAWAKHLPAMKSISLDLVRELAALDQSTAAQFKYTVLAMMRRVKAGQARKAQPFAERIARHPAIGTWPAHLDGDKHISTLRDEWSR